MEHKLVQIPFLKHFIEVSPENIFFLFYMQLLKMLAKILKFERF